MPHPPRDVIRSLPRRPRAARPGCEALEGRALLTYYTALDPTFGARGKVVGAADAGTGAELSIGSAVALQADGKVVEVGTYSNPPASYLGSLGQLAVRRFNADGSLDTTFGTAGQVDVPLPGGATNIFAAPRDVVISPADGSISFAASAALPGPSNTSPASEGFVARLTAAGALDTTFAAGGEYVFTGTDTGAASVALQPDGRLLVLSSNNDNGANQLVLSRLTSAGVPDTTFNGTGSLTIAGQPVSSPFGGAIAYTAGAMVVTPTGQVYVAGNETVSNQFQGPYPQVATLTRVNPDGTTDTSYGTNGTTNINNVAVNGLGLQSDGKVVAVGGTERTFFQFGYIGRYTTQGALDPSFAGNIDPETSTIYFPVLTSVVVGAGDTITVAGGQIPSSTSGSGTVARYLPDGTHDSTFGHGGVVTIGQLAPSGTPNRGAAVAINSIAVAPQGQIILAGGLSEESYYGARYNFLGRVLPVATTPLIGDYDGDGVSDVAAYLTDPAVYAVRPSSGTTDLLTSFGKPGAGGSIPAPGDYNGDGLTDLGVYVPSLGQLIYRASSYYLTGDTVVNFGIAAGDLASVVPAVGDYDGDGVSDPAVYDQATGEFLIASTPKNDQVNYTITAIPFGAAGLGASVPAPGDYDGDGKTDLAVYIPRYGVLAYRPSSGGPDVLTSFGMPGDRMSIPAPGDYDGDGKTDLAVYMPSIGVYAYRPSSAGDTTGDVLRSFGVVGDGASIPAPGDYDGDGKTDLAVYVPQDALYAYRPSSAAVASPDALTTFGTVGTGATVPTASIPYAQSPTVSGMGLAASAPSAGVPVALTDDVLELLAGTTGRKKRA